MSWAKDEWKQELPPKALQKICDMEKEYENLQRLRQQQDLKIDGYVTALEKGKIDLEEERSSSAVLQKEVQELTIKVSNLEAKEERYANEIKNKEKAVEYGEELLEKARHKLKVENEKVMELEKSLEQERSEAEKYGERSEKMSVEVGKLKQEKAHISKENENYKERLGALTKELQTLRQIISENEQKAMKVAQESEKDNDESCHQEPVAMGSRSDAHAFLDILKKENRTLLRDLEQLKLQREQMKSIIEEKTNEIERSATKVAEMRIEVQDLRRELKTSKGKVSKLEGTVESRDRELGNLKEKVAKYKVNEERMKNEIKTLTWKNQLEAQNKHDELVEQSKRLETADVEKGRRPSDSENHAEESKVAAMEDKICQLSKENESLHEQLRCLREINSALAENAQEKDNRLKLYYNEKHDEIKKEEARLERVENLLLENGRLKERVRELENEERTSSASVNVCARCKQEMMPNDDNSSQKNSGADKKERTLGSEDGADEKMVTCKDVVSTPEEVDGTTNEAMTDNMEVDEGLQVNGKSLQTAAGVDKEQVTYLEHRYQGLNKDAEDDDIDVISCATTEHNSSLQHKILQVLLSLSTIQMEHEMVLRGVNKCYSTVKRIKQVLNSQVSDTENQDSMSKLYFDVDCLFSQLNSAKAIGQRCTTSVKSQIDSIAGYLEKIKEIDRDVHDDLKGSRSPERELSWDNFESERAFQTFKEATVDPLVKQIEDEVEDTLAKDCMSNLQATTSKQNDLRKGSQTNKQMNPIDRPDSAEPECKPHVTENALEFDDFVDVFRNLMEESNDLLSERMESLLQHFETNMLKNIAEIQKERQNKQKFPKSAENSSREEDDTAVVNPGKEEKHIFEELELMKKKICGVQKLVKHLMSSIELTKQEKEETHSHIDILTTQMRNMSSHHDMRYTELERTLRTASERELTLQRQINDLQTAKEDMSCNYKESLDNLRQKEQELAKLLQEIRNIQAKSKENEQKLKNKIEVLQGEKTCVWHDYMEASKEARERKNEIESLVAKMKKTEVSLMSLFNTIGNIDDFLQRAKEMNLFQ
ncbi:centromere protein F-like [Actinia tenebrosa]|uniref:Centromere protein F-like n=1 Tax=Actinia tenebrosa TaxID=6105 RepID=A0A6P8HXC6_ACTTE|nr:centromere protein F-like [Actinia tenebrosa]